LETKLFDVILKRSAFTPGLDFSAEFESDLLDLFKIFLEVFQACIFSMCRKMIAGRRDESNIGQSIETF
jgi:hypothetical protein